MGAFMSEPTSSTCEPLLYTEYTEPGTLGSENTICKRVRNTHERNNSVTKVVECEW